MHLASYTGGLCSPHVIGPIFRRQCGVITHFNFISILHAPLSFQDRIDSIVGLALPSMDPASIVGITASTITLVRLLGAGVLSVKNLLYGIRNVDEITRGFGEELDAFQFSLTILDYELQKGSL